MMKIIRIFELAWILFVVALLSGCSTVKPGHDAIVVRAEQAAEIGLLTFDTLFLIEFENREWIDEHQPKIRGAVNHLRDYAPMAIKSLRAATHEYKLLKTDVARSNLVRLTESVSRGISEARELITTIEQKNAP